jgi:hypothetical protein
VNVGAVSLTGCRMRSTPLTAMTRTLWCNLISCDTSFMPSGDDMVLLRYLQHAAVGGGTHQRVLGGRGRENGARVPTSRS